MRQYGHLWSSPRHQWDVSVEELSRTLKGKRRHSPPLKDTNKTQAASFNSLHSTNAWLSERMKGCTRVSLLEKKYSRKGKKGNMVCEKTSMELSLQKSYLVTQALVLELITNRKGKGLWESTAAFFSVVDYFLLNFQEFKACTGQNFVLLWQSRRPKGRKQGNFVFTHICVKY